MQDLALLATKFSLVDMFVLMSFHKLIAYFEEKLRYAKLSLKTFRYIEYNVHTAGAGSDRTKLLYTAIEWYTTRHATAEQDYDSCLLSPKELTWSSNFVVSENLKADHFNRYVLIKRPRANQWCKIGDIHVQFNEVTIPRAKRDVDVLRSVVVCAQSNAVIDEFLSTCIQEFITGVMIESKKRVYVWYRDTHFVTAPLMDHSFDDVYFPGKDEYVRLVQKYHAENRSCVILLTGKPGTGKTSTIKATASLLKRSVVDVKLDKHTIDTLNSRQFGEETIEFNRGCFVLEDIDALSDVVFDRSSPKPTNEKTEVVVKMLDDSPPITLSELLNTLDGVMDAPGRFIFMSTNYPEKLDAALIRAGRVNIRVDYPEFMPHDLAQRLVSTKFPDVVVPEGIQKSAAEWKRLVINSESLTF